MDIAAKQDIKIDSVDGSLLISASKDITLVCGGSYIKISGSGIELGTSANVSVKSAALEKMGPSQLNLSATHYLFRLLIARGSLNSSTMTVI